nr:MAG TPA: bacterial surface protein [Herelleviridae sp.]
MSEMFNSCSGLTSLDVSHFDTSKVTQMYNMFSSCTSLRTIKVINETSANRFIAQINGDLRKTATWDSETKIITIP